MFNPTVNQSCGFTLIEVLVSLVILSTGLLGVAGMQINSLKNNQSAYYRTQAVNLAYELADSMRANPAGVANGHYDEGVPLKNDNCENNTGCSNSEMAGNDLFQWSSNSVAHSIANTLLKGSGVACIDSTPDDGCIAGQFCDGIGSTYAIKTFWLDRLDNAASAGADCSNYEQSNEVRFVMTFIP
ncbi:MAG: type IV pilus modification protein PilV [gamma proteobacterium symbiont of Taylorina sp.]|nr:type IV pilus modification protein PilV [gamma proteobacterium symbiont of Taylorina sp.]